MWFFSAEKKIIAYKAEQINKMTTTYFHSKFVILWIFSALQAVLSFSAWEKPRDSTPNNGQKLEDI